jgi:hypothetical protein
VEPGCRQCALFQQTQSIPGAQPASSSMITVGPFSEKNVIVA